MSGPGINAEWFTETLHPGDDVAGTSPNETDFNRVKVKKPDDTWVNEDFNFGAPPDFCYYHAQEQTPIPSSSHGPTPRNTAADQKGGSSMSKRIFVTISVVAAIAASAVGGAVALDARSGGDEPTLHHVTALSTGDSLSSPSGMSLTAPTPEVASAVPISAQQALAVAWQEEGLRAIRPSRTQHWLSSPRVAPTSRRRSG